MFDRRKGEKVRPSDQLNILMELACTQGGREHGAPSGACMVIYLHWLTFFSSKPKKTFDFFQGP